MSKLIPPIKNQWNEELNPENDEKIEHKFIFERNEFSMQLLKTLFIFQNENHIYLSRPEIHDVLINNNDYYSNSLDFILTGTDNFIGDNLTKFLDDVVLETSFFNVSQISIINTFIEAVDVSYII